MKYCDCEYNQRVVNNDVIAVSEQKITVGQMKVMCIIINTLGVWKGVG